MVTEDNQINVDTSRNFLVVKHNDIIQNARFHLTVQEQRIVLFLISKIKPASTVFDYLDFNISDFCKMCGIDSDSGGNYNNIKQTLKELRDKSIWIKLADGSETTLAWIDNVIMNRKSGNVKIKMADLMRPFLLGLQKNFTQYELLYILAMRSQYSIRLYELLRSYEWKHGDVEIDLEELKRNLFAEKYTRFPDFKRKVIDIAIREINELSDISASYNIIKKGRKFVKLAFTIRIKTGISERRATWVKIEEFISPSQMSLYGNIEQ